MNNDEDILIKRINKFVKFMTEKHGSLSAGLIGSIDKIKSHLSIFEVVYPTIEKTTELVYWAERSSEIKEVEVKFKDLADHFWD
jgi:hypothetical protein